MHQFRQDLMTQGIATFSIASRTVCEPPHRAARYLARKKHTELKSDPERKHLVMQQNSLLLSGSFTKPSWKDLCGGHVIDPPTTFVSRSLSISLRARLTKQQRRRRRASARQQDQRRRSATCYADAWRNGSVGHESILRIPSQASVKIFQGGKSSHLKFEPGALTDDQDTLSGDEGDEDFSNDVEIVSTDGETGTESSTVGFRKQGQNLGSYAATTAIAFQDTLPPEGFVVLMSCAVGLMTGACVVFFNYAVDAIHDIAWEGIPKTGAAWLRSQPFETSWQQVVFVPATGGLVVGILNYLRTNLEGKEGQNPLWRNVNVVTSKVMKACAAAVTLGTANSLGPEGPSVEIGASIANGVTAILKNSRERKLSLVAAGSAAGIASGFNAAVAGCFFAVESVLSGFSSDSAPSLTTAMVLLSSVLAAVVSQAGLGSDPAFRIPAYDFRSPTELPLYLLLGALCGGVSVALSKGTSYATTTCESLQKKTGLPSAFLPPVGGLCVGIIALAYPEVLYWGFENVNTLLEVQPPWVQVPSATLLVQILGAKIVATSVCRGSGLVGGMYAPSLFIGAALGSAYGSFTKDAFLNTNPILHLDVLQVAAPQAYALVGMAATLAGVCQVPLTSVLLLFELTRDYRIILPLMAAVGVSSFVASSFQKKAAGRAIVQIKTPVTSNETVSITRFSKQSESQRLDGVLLTNARPSSSVETATSRGSKEESEPKISEDDILCNLENTLCLSSDDISEERLADEILVTTAMKSWYTAVTGDTPLREAVARMLNQKQWCVLIVNHVMHLEGLLTLSDIQQEAEKASRTGRGLELEKQPMSTLLRSIWAGREVRVITAYPDMTLKVAQRLMAGRGLRQIPIVAREEDGQSKRLVGLLDRESIKLACRAEATSRILRFSGPLAEQAFLNDR